ncbi:hypothetical protein Calow_2209 [Caldicellulosiruptor owensensis OL]|uniref:CRISPR type III A-associated protein Csm5 n=1 Tax=Caldicellulosiruptor owensensis (strain ATCC 700167 / DSM 13100 / OL) TaxID=632518 RepID=E4Q732_CALOW|nr:hypothetical protein [Caldicellulosiruptor owensensis]ADQ05712.1 hypothetical protein Calow_2209 [Caldicellulosiruptor owensensis OL]
MEKEISYKTYKVLVEAISDFCVSANQDFNIKSSEYLINGKFAYIIENSSVVKMLEDGVISENELEDIKAFLQAHPEYLEKYFGDYKLELASEYDNNIGIIRFWRFSELADNSYRERYAIPASTVKGILKTGFLSFFLNSADYKYGRVGNKKRLQLMLLKPNNLKDKAKNTQQLYEILINQNDVKKGVHLYKLVGENTWKEINEIDNIILSTENMLFRNIICSDLVVKDGRFVVKKVNRISRVNKKSATLQYIELAQKGSLFEGEIKEVNHLKDLPVNMLSFLYYKDLNYPENLNLIDICREGLKKFSKKIIEAERKHFAQRIKDLNPQNSEFYDTLLSEVENEEIIIKLGRGGIHAKSFMSFDSNNLSKQDFFPYTINVDDADKLPIGWVKLRIEEEKR